MRLGLERAGIRTVWANDIDPAKQAMYEANFSAKEFVLGDIRDIRGEQLPRADLATASFPCIDLSLAGNRQGLGRSAAPKGAYWESSMFWEFARLIKEMGSGRPRAVLCENVLGFASSNGGDDLAQAIRALNGLGYSCDVFVADARHFVPQSRPRVFVIGTTSPPTYGEQPATDARPKWLIDLSARYPDLNVHTFPLAPLPTGPASLSRYVQRIGPDDPRWWDTMRLQAFVDSLSPIQRERLDLLRSERRKVWRTAYRRTREGRAVWEIRADGIAGCLRTARGGSSKQALVEANHGEVRVRWMTAREYANLMGAPPTFRLPTRSSQALFGFGDAVCVPVIAWICENYLVPLVVDNQVPMSRAA
jgi:DNA (cytosine-5)-methyltransferase 1